MYTHIYMYIHLYICTYLWHTIPDPVPVSDHNPPVNLSSSICTPSLRRAFQFRCMYVCTHYIYHNTYITIHISYIMCTQNIYCVRTYINSIFARLFGEESSNSSCSSSSTCCTSCTSCSSCSSWWAFGTRSFAQIRGDGSGRRTRGGRGRGARGGGVKQSSGSFLEVAVTQV